MRAALGLLSCLIPLAAHAATYTLADQNGVPTCTFVDLTLSDQLAYGNLHANRCAPPMRILAGSGVSTRIDGSPDRVWSFSTGLGYGTLLYLFDLKALTWVQYYYDVYNPLQLAGSGVLLKGNHKPPASARPH